MTGASSRKRTSNRLCCAWWNMHWRHRLPRKREFAYLVAVRLWRTEKVLLILIALLLVLTFLTLFTVSGKRAWNIIYNPRNQEDIKFGESFHRTIPKFLFSFLLSRSLKIMTMWDINLLHIFFKCVSFTQNVVDWEEFGELRCNMG
jgi:hypothetical protein